VPDELLKRVRYQRCRMTIDPGMIDVDGPAAEAFMADLISTKSSHWRYENEVRCFVALDERDPDTGLYFADFSDQLALREVIIGHCSTISRADLSRAFGDLAPVVKTRKARLAFRSFRIVTQRRADMWS
jgi:hypothetical protein